MSDETPKKKKKLSNNLPLLIVIGAIVVLLAGLLIWLYTGKLNTAKSNVFGKVPLPIALINNRILTGPELINRLELANKLVEQGGQQSTEIKQQVYDQLIDTKKVEALAATRRLTVSNDEINQEFDKIVLQFAEGDKDKFNTDLKNSYGMSEQEFKRTVLRQDILQYKLAVWFNEQESLNSDAYKQAQELKAKLDSGQPFDEVASQYTQDEATKDFAGDSGFVALDDLLPEFQSGLKDAQIGETKQIASRYGLHIIKVLEKDNNGENGSERLHLQQIFVQPSDFNKWYEDQIKQMRVIKLLNV